MLVNTKYWVHWFCSISRKLSTQGGGGGSGGVLGVHLSLSIPCCTLIWNYCPQITSGQTQGLWTACFLLNREAATSAAGVIFGRTMSNHSLFPTISGDHCYRITSYRILPALYSVDVHHWGLNVSSQGFQPSVWKIKLKVTKKMKTLYLPYEDASTGDTGRTI